MVIGAQQELMLLKIKGLVKMKGKRKEETIDLDECLKKQVTR
jgi:hypothetical protein